MIDPQSVPGPGQRRDLVVSLAFWFGALVLLIGFFYLFRTILLPFVAGVVIAYFLDPVADRLCRWGLGRLFATVLILLLFLVLFAIVLIVVVPYLGAQVVDLLQSLPDLIARLQIFVTTEGRAWIEEITGRSFERDLAVPSIEQLLRGATDWMQGLLQSLWSGGMWLVDVASLFVITPVVAFYVLYDWDRMVARIDGWLPRRSAGTVRDLAREMNARVAAFIRGQTSMCFILAVYYAGALALTGLNFGIVIGLITGLISFVPFVGAFVGFSLAAGFALAQYLPEGNWTALGIVAAVFAFGQFFEGNVLQPRIVGPNVGLHPVALIFSLVAFGYMFGFIGLLLAVPLAASIAVLVRFALVRYLGSAFYGEDDLLPPSANAEEF